jgi:hypothetical protein
MNKITTLVLIAATGLGAMAFVGCASAPKMKIGINGPEPFGKTLDGQS